MTATLLVSFIAGFISLAKRPTRRFGETRTVDPIVFEDFVLTSRHGVFIWEANRS